MCSWATRGQQPGVSALQKQGPGYPNTAGGTYMFYAELHRKEKNSPSPEIVAVQWLAYPCSHPTVFLALSWDTTHRGGKGASGAASTAPCNFVGCLGDFLDFASYIRPFLHFLALSNL